MGEETDLRISHAHDKANIILRKFNRGLLKYLKWKHPEDVEKIDKLEEILEGMHPDDEIA